MAYQLWNLALHALFLVVVVVVISEVLAVFMHFGYLAFKWSFSTWFCNWLVSIPELFWWLNYVFVLFNHPLNTLSWNRFEFYVFPFFNSRWWNWLVCISKLFWGLDYVFILVNHLLDAIAWLLSLSIFSCLSIFILPGGRAIYAPSCFFSAILKWLKISG